MWVNSIMKHDYSLAHLTVLSLTPPQVVDVAARTSYNYVSLRLTRVTSQEPLYDLARDKTMMRETKARLADTGIAVHDIELFRMDPSLNAESFIPVLEATAELGARTSSPSCPILTANGQRSVSTSFAIWRNRWGSSSVSNFRTGPKPEIFRQRFR
jgi:hypothetical protein